MPQPDRVALWHSHHVVEMVPCLRDGCTELVRRTFQTTLCEAHAHTPGICRCMDCRRRDKITRAEARAKQDAAARHRPGTRAYTPLTITFGDGPSRTAPVSLPAEPWAAEA